jgi:rhombotail lipoprotein
VGIGLLQLSLLPLLTGCAGQQSGAKGSVVDYMYPAGMKKVIEPSIPQLRLPLKVGVAFVPETATTASGINFYTGAVKHSGALTEAKKSELLEQVAGEFRSLDYIESIEVIPGAYLSPGGGFANLDQIQTMYGIDVVALVSYDQVQFTDEGMLTLSYWTIVGMYVVSGQKNDTSTLVDTVVYDISSRKMLFRAPGQSNVKGNATPISQSEELRHDSVLGFEQATTQMIANLQQQLSVFEEKIKNVPDEVQISYREGYSGGGGAMGLAELTLLLGLLVALRSRQYRATRRR